MYTAFSGSHQDAIKKGMQARATAMRSVRCAACDLQRAVCSVQRAMCSVRCAACDMQRARHYVMPDLATLQHYTYTIMHVYAHATRHAPQKGVRRVT